MYGLLTGMINDKRNGIARICWNDPGSAYEWSLPVLLYWKLWLFWRLVSQAMRLYFQVISAWPRQAHLPFVRLHCYLNIFLLLKNIPTATPQIRNFSDWYIWRVSTHTSTKLALQTRAHVKLRTATAQLWGRRLKIYIRIAKNQLTVTSLHCVTTACNILSILAWYK